MLQGDPDETATGYYKLYDVPENYDMFVNNNPYEELLYDKDPKTEAEYGDGGAWGDRFMNAADMQAGAVDAQLKALQAQLELQKGENNSYYDDIAAQAYGKKTGTGWLCRKVCGTAASSCGGSLKRAAGAGYILSEQH